MKYLLLIALFFSLLPGLATCAEPIKVRLKLTNAKSFSGEITERVDGAVLFLPQGSAKSVRISDEQIALIRLPLGTLDQEALTRLYEDGQYQKMVDLLDPELSPYMDYTTLPTNLDEEFLRWMIVSYWSGQPDRVRNLADALTRVELPEFKQATLFYRHLVQMDRGDLQSMVTFLKSPLGETTYPQGSAARYYIDARILQQQGLYIPAIRTVALMMVEHSRAADWMPKAELLCEEIYFQLEMPDSAKAVLADINKFYSDPVIQQQAAAIAAGK